MALRSRAPLIPHPRQWPLLATQASDRAYGAWLELGPRAKAAFIFFSALYGGLALLIFIIGPETVFQYTAQAAAWLSHQWYGKLVVLSLLIITAFPPTVGYGTAVTLCGLAYGSAAGSQGGSDSKNAHTVWEGWLLAASGCLLGATASFVVLRLLLRRYAHLPMLKGVTDNQRFAAMGEAIRSRGTGMVVLIRFCPFPFCYSNLFFASIESVSLLQFIFATALITPKLLLHVFIGARMYELMDRESRAHLDWTSKVLNGVYIVLGSLVGIGTGWYVWRETQRILDRLERERERENGGGGGGPGLASGAEEEQVPFVLEDELSDEDEAGADRDRGGEADLELGSGRPRKGQRTGLSPAGSERNGRFPAVGAAGGRMNSSLSVR